MYKHLVKLLKSKYWDFQDFVIVSAISTLPVEIVFYFCKAPIGTMVGYFLLSVVCWVCCVLVEKQDLNSH